MTENDPAYEMYKKRTGYGGSSLNEYHGRAILNYYTSDGEEALVEFDTKVLFFLLPTEECDLWFRSVISPVEPELREPGAAD